jgi:hypothetical protein
MQKRFAILRDCAETFVNAEKIKIHAHPVIKLLYVNGLRLNFVNRLKPD